MAIDPSARGALSSAHVSLTEAGAIARNRGLSPFVSAGTARFQPPSAVSAPRSNTRTNASAANRHAAPGARRVVSPHTPVVSHGDADPDQWDGMLNRLGKAYNVPPLFLKAVMLIESGGRPDAVGDSGHSVGLFQLHDQGYGAGMGDARFDPEQNAERAARGLAEAWHAGERAGFTGEHAIRAAYNYSFNPGGGWAYQGDALVATYNELRAEQGLSPAS